MTSKSIRLLAKVSTYYVDWGREVVLEGKFLDLFLIRSKLVEGKLLWRDLNGLAPCALLHIFKLII